MEPTWVEGISPGEAPGLDVAVMSNGDLGIILGDPDDASRWFVLSRMD